VGALSPAELPVKKIEAVKHTPSGNISGIILTATGKPLYFHYDIAANSLTSPSAAISSLTGIADISVDDNLKKAYLFNKTTKQLYEVQLTNVVSPAPSAVALGTAASSSFTGTVQSISKNGNSILLAGDAGLLWKFDITSLQYANQTENLKPLPG
jgi:hypothetical protein